MRSQPDWFIESSPARHAQNCLKRVDCRLINSDMNGRPLTLKEMKALDDYDAAFRKAKP